MADLGNVPITSDSSDEHLRKRAAHLCAKFGGPTNLYGYVLQLERRIAHLEQASRPPHLANVEQR